MDLNQAQAGFSIWGFIKKHWYIILTIIVIIPTLLSIIQNPAEGFLRFGQKLLTADNLINKDVNMLRTDPASLIGMSYPTQGAYNHFVYFIHLFKNVIWEISTNLWLLFFPMAIIYFIVGLFNHGIVMKNIFISFLIFLFYLFIINCIMLFIDGSLAIPENLSGFQAFFYVFKNILPFHGSVNLVGYLVSLIR